MNGRLLMCFSLVLLIAIPTISEDPVTSYLIHFRFELPKNAGVKQYSGKVEAMCTVEERLHVEEAQEEESDSTIRPKKSRAKKGAVQEPKTKVEPPTKKARTEKPSSDVYRLKSFTLQPGGAMEDVTVNAETLKSVGAERIAVADAVVQCTFKRGHKEGIDVEMKLRVLDTEGNPRFGRDVTKAWAESTWELVPEKMYLTWYVRPGLPSPAERPYRVLAWVPLGDPFWPSPAFLNHSVGESTPAYVWQRLNRGDDVAWNAQKRRQTSHKGLRVPQRPTTT